MATTKKTTTTKKAAPKKVAPTIDANQNPDAVVIGDEDNKSFKKQSKEINKNEKKQEKETAKEAKEAFGGKKEGNWFTRMFHRKNK